MRYLSLDFGTAVPQVQTTIGSMIVSAKKPVQEGEASSERPVCGVIMPISETATHSEPHWQNVQTLLHRAISLAGFEPRNVWESTATDRISERIIGNIFQVPIAVADITDLNPNVMLELGLRLAPKKPTIVIATLGSAIPFDIRDFHTSFYPADMNMLGMEDFFRRLGKVLQDKMAISKTDNYTPFLGSVIVNVASPEMREVGVNDLLLSRLDEVAHRLISVEASVKRPRNVAGSSANRPRSSAPATSGTIEVSMPVAAIDEFSNEVLALYEVDDVSRKSTRNGVALLRLAYSESDDRFALDTKVSEIAERFGGELEVPF